MSSNPSLARRSPEAQRAIGDVHPQMLKADLVKGESVDYLEQLGACLDFARRSVGWTQDQLAGELGRDKKQVGRWLRGEERTQVDTVFAVKALRVPFVIALARLADGFEEQTVLTFRRQA